MESNIGIRRRHLLWRAAGAVPLTGVAVVVAEVGRSKGAAWSLEAAVMFTLKATRLLCPITVGPQGITTTVVGVVVVVSGVTLVAVLLSMPFPLIIMANMPALVRTPPFPRQRISMRLEAVGVVDGVDGAEVRLAEDLAEDVEALVVRAGEAWLEARRPLDRRLLLHLPLPSNGPHRVMSRI